jgi:glutathione S-transferase
MLKIYGIARTRTARTLWMAHELGIPYEHIKVAVVDGGTARPEFRALNPNGRVPAIDDDGVVVWEPLAPRSLAEDSHMTMWSLWAASEFEPEAHEVLVHTVNLPPEKRDAARLALALERLRRPLDALEVSLARGGGHLVGGRFTVADLNVACIAFYLRAAPHALAAHAGIRAWYAAATERPAFRKMIALREAE